MKKVLFVLAGLVLVLTMFAGCGKTDATKNVEKQISAIGNVDKNSQDAIDGARKAYDSLSEEEKGKVKNYSELEKAESSYKDIVDMNNDIAAILDAAHTDFSDDTADISELIKRAGEITAACKEMSEERKQQVVDLDKLEAAAKKLNGYVEVAQTAAANYVKAFKQYKQDKQGEITGVYCIKQIRNGTDEFHFFALTYKEADGKETTVYSQARSTSEVSVEAIATHPETFFAAVPVSEDSDAKANGNISLDLKTVLEKAK